MTHLKAPLAPALLTLCFLAGLTVFNWPVLAALMSLAPTMRFFAIFAFWGLLILTLAALTLFAPFGSRYLGRNSTADLDSNSEISEKDGRHEH